MQIIHAGFSCQGPRQKNEDRLLYPLKTHSEIWISAIADGVGGAAGGAEAAQVAVEAASSFDGTEDMSFVFYKAANSMRSLIKTNEELKKMATTLSLLTIHERVANVAHVGDSRIYHLRNAGLKNLTEDQTQIAELLRKGVLSEHQARRYPRRNVLTSALSANGDYEIFRSEATLRSGDRLLLITDGVHEKLKRGAIVNLSLSNNDIFEFASSIQKEVSLNQPKDNFSAIALQIYD